MPRRRVDWYGPRLRELRERTNVTQAELGKRVNLAGSQINKLETNVNQPTLATALAIADALEVSIMEFLPSTHAKRVRTPHAKSK
jgi:transcriptional regulator with XRE-family HTH domain